MIETKLFEVRDDMTFIPVMAVRFQSSDDAERYLLLAVGFALDLPYPYVFLWRLAALDKRPTIYPAEWNCRSMTPAHKYIADNWDELTSGQVIDARVLRGERAEPVISQRLEDRPACGGCG